MSTASGELNARQLVTMTDGARQRLRTTAASYDISHGPFARVLIDKALDLLESDQDFQAEVAEAVEVQKSLYKWG